jgi:hypothetical protein
MPTGSGLKDEGQERQEAKTKDSQEDVRLEAFEKGKGPVTDGSCSRKNRVSCQQTGIVRPITRYESGKKATDCSVAFFLCLLSARFRRNSILNKTT